MFDTIPMHGRVVIGEGEMDEAPMLYIGEELGLRNGGPEVDIAVDPLEGTNIVAKGTNGAMTVLAIADRGNLLNAPDMYMEKLAVGPEAAGKVSIEASVTENLSAVAKAKNRDISDVVATLLDRERHQPIVDEIRAAGARIKFIQDGDVGAAINTAFDETGIDTTTDRAEPCPTPSSASRSTQLFTDDYASVLRVNVTTNQRLAFLVYRHSRHTRRHGLRYLYIQKDFLVER